MKNFLIAILVIALAISGYFNWKSSKVFKIEPQKDILRITIMGTKITKDSSVKPVGDSGVPVLIGVIDFLPTKCNENDYTQRYLCNVPSIQPVTIKPETEPTNLYFLPGLFKDYRNVFLGKITIAKETQQASIQKNGIGN